MHLRANLMAITATAALLAMPASAQWRYETEKNPMTDQVDRWANLASTNRQNLSFPYHGGTRARIILRMRKGQLAVMLDIDRGQLLCHDTCEVMVRFDDKPAVEFEASPPADYSNDTLFLRMNSTFIKQLREAKRVRIELPFFQEGTRLFEFKPQGLKWQDE
jgi:hypothetical protein